MRNNDRPKHDSGRTNGFIPTSFRTISGYLRIVSSGASTVASTVRSAASSIVDKGDDANHDQVQWAGFDKLECEGKISRQVLLLGYRFGFQVWDVEEADNVRDLVSRHDGPVSFLQMLPKPIASKKSKDKYADSRPILVVCADGSLSGGGTMQDGFGTPYKEGIQSRNDTVNGRPMPTVLQFYSLKSQSYVHVMKFRSVIYSVRCSSRVVAISQAAQIHCFDIATLEREYTLLTNPVVTGSPSSGSIGYGPLAVGPRWVAYSGSPVVVTNCGRVSPQHLTTSTSFSGSSSNGSLVAHYAKESSKQLAAGIMSLRDIGYQKLSRYCSELLPDSNNLPHCGSPGPGLKANGTVNSHFLDADNVGMVIVRDITTKSVITQFKAHKSPISALCFDPSGILLVTASVQGHNINVFRIMPGVAGSSSGLDTCASYAHLYRLQRGFTNAVIQDISFSDDSKWIMISSSRGTSHLFTISPTGGSVNLHPSDTSTAQNSGLGVPTKPAVPWLPNSGVHMLSQQNFCASGPPVTLSVVSRIRSGNNRWRSTVTGAAAAATGRMGYLSGAIASSFHNCKANDTFSNSSSLEEKYHLLVFSPSGCVIQYALRISNGIDSTAAVSGLSPGHESPLDGDARLVVEAVQKWNVCQKQYRREREDNIDIYGENGNMESKIFPRGIKKKNPFHPETIRSAVSKSNISPEERHHLYISEAELQMHQAQNPLWAKPEIYFHTLMVDRLEESTLGGEIEIERFPTCMIEARSKELVPVFDYLQTPKFQRARFPALDGNTYGHLLHHKTEPSENGRLSRRSSSGSFDSAADGGATVAELSTGVEETNWDSLRMPTETAKGFVNRNDKPKTKTTLLETVNNRKSFKKEAQLEFVNNSKDSLNVENQLDDEDEFD